MKNPVSPPPVLDPVPFDPSQPPDCITLHEQGDSLVIRYKDPSLGYGLLGLPAMYVFTIVAYTISVGGVPISELIGAAVLGVLIALIPVAMIINVTTITIGGGEMVITRGPLSLSSRKQLRADEIEGLHVKAERGQKSGSTTFNLRAMLTGTDKPRLLMRFGRDNETAFFMGKLIFGRLGLPGELTFVGV